MPLHVWSGSAEICKSGNFNTLECGEKQGYQKSDKAEHTQGARMSGETKDKKSWELKPQGVAVLPCADLCTMFMKHHRQQTARRSGTARHFQNMNMTMAKSVPCTRRTPNTTRTCNAHGIICTMRTCGTYTAQCTARTTRTHGTI